MVQILTFLATKRPDSNACAGPISSVTVLGTTLVLINDKDIAFDLLEKRSTIYSSRPSMTFAGEL